MNATDQAKLQAALASAFIRAIQATGRGNFKATSMFGSSDRAADQKKAA
jgi:hypothetical protein